MSHVAFHDSECDGATRSDEESTRWDHFVDLVTVLWLVIFSAIRTHIPEVSAFHVNGSMSAGTRDAIMTAFAQAQRGLVSNVRCLTEGVDVPAVDMVAFLTPKRSLIDIVQATGRAMRTSDATHKTTGYVLLPLFVEEMAGESIDDALSRAEYDAVWAVLEALKEHDEVLT